MGLTSSLRERKKQRTSEGLYDAALELFAERSYADVTVEEICERAEVGRATFFRFFGTKAGLLVEFNRRMTAAIAERIAADPSSTATDQLWIVQEEIARTWGASGPAMREMAREWIRNATAHEFTAEPPHAELLDLVTHVVSQGQRAGEFIRGQDARFVAWMIIGALAAVTAGWLASGDDTLTHGTHEALDLLLGGLHR